GRDGYVENGTLIIDGGTFDGLQGTGFNGNFGTIILTNGVKVATANPNTLTMGSGLTRTNNTVIVEGEGTVWDFGLRDNRGNYSFHMVSHNNLVWVRDGAMVTNSYMLGVGNRGADTSSGNTLRVSDGGVFHEQYGSGWADTIPYIRGSGNVIEALRGGRLMLHSRNLLQYANNAFRVREGGYVYMHQHNDGAYPYDFCGELDVAGTHPSTFVPSTIEGEAGSRIPVIRLRDGGKMTVREDAVVRGCTLTVNAGGSLDAGGGILENCNLNVGTGAEVAVMPDWRFHAGNITANGSLAVTNGAFVPRTGAIAVNGLLHVVGTDGAGASSTLNANGSAVTVNAGGKLHVADCGVVSNCTFTIGTGGTETSFANINVTGGGFLQSQGDHIVTVGRHHARLTVSGAGSEWTQTSGEFRNGFHQNNNRGFTSDNGLIVENGGTATISGMARIAGADWNAGNAGGTTAYAVSNFVAVVGGGGMNFNGNVEIAVYIGGINTTTHPVEMIGNHIFAGGTDETPGVVALKGGTLNIANSSLASDTHALPTGNFIEAGAHGEFVGVGALTVGNARPAVTNNFARTSGGVINCASLTVNAGNGLEPVISAIAKDTGMIRATNATFADGAYVRPSAEKDAPYGRFQILESANPISAGVIADGKSTFLKLAEDVGEGWRMRVTTNEIWVYRPFPATTIIIR
ncbi:MAG: hypothetical protein FWG05_06010, partial [Kiritimatiellaeota bacterium]|nr:hypothetical protein [Kiritimatiellota bacterium]